MGSSRKATDKWELAIENGKEKKKKTDRYRGREREKEEDRQSNKSSSGRQVGAEDRGGEGERDTEKERQRARRADPLKTLYFTKNRYGTVLIGVFKTYLVLMRFFHNNMNGNRAKLGTLS